jgi:uracil-DNA glycosylase
MYKELKADIPDFVIPNHGTLSGWARQGVLLLNACLTVEKNKANSHKGKGWEKFTVRNIRKIVLFVIDFEF